MWSPAGSAPSKLQQVAAMSPMIPSTPQSGGLARTPHSPSRFGVAMSPGGVTKTVRLRGTMTADHAGATWHCRLLTLNLRSDSSVDGTYESDQGSPFPIKSGYWDTTGKVSFVFAWTQGDYQVTGTMNPDCSQYVGTWLNCDPGKAHLSGQRGRHHFSRS